MPTPVDSEKLYCCPNPLNGHNSIMTDENTGTRDTTDNKNAGQSSATHGTLTTDLKEIIAGDSFSLPDRTNNFVRVAHGEKTQISFSSLNVCGLVSKLKYPEFIDLIHQHEIIEIQESKLDDTDKIDIPGYTVFFSRILEPVF